MKPRYLNDKDPWMLAEDIPDIDLFFSYVWLHCFVNTFQKETGRAYRKILSIYHGYHLWFYFGTKDSKKVGDVIVKKLLRDPRFAVRINRQCIAWADRLEAYARLVPKKLRKLSDGELLKIYLGHFKVHLNGYEWGWIPVAADMFHNNLTEALKSHLRNLGVAEERINPDLVLLTQPLRKSEIQIEQESLLKIASKIEASKTAKKLFSKSVQEIKRALPINLNLSIENHCRKYYWLKFQFMGSQGVYDRDHYLRELKRIISEGLPKQELRGILSKTKQELQERRVLIKKLGIRNPWLTIVDQWGEFMVTKIYRRFAQIHLLYAMEAVLKELGRRYNLSLMQMRFLLPQEVEDLVQKSKKPSEVAQRTKLCVYYAEKGFDKLFFGREAERLEKQTQREIASDIKELHGQIGCSGYGKGRVKIIIRAEDMKKFEKGDILVSIATDPDIVPAMKKAAAIVTEQGGVTSHAAIVSRELGIPCIIGTKIATKVLKDGDLVEVDANKGVVRKVDK